MMIYECSPHYDIENNIARKPIKYHECLPDEGVNSETGLIFTISGYGWGPEMEYEIKLRSYLANKYNCIVIGVEYFGIWLKILKFENLRMTDQMHVLMEKLLGISIKRGTMDDEVELLGMFIRYVIGNGIKNIPSEYCILNDACGSYQSFGFLPALDYLKVMAKVIDKYSVNKKRLYLLGSSFGGYIALLIGKLAPNSFRLIIDNSGFSETLKSNIYGGGGSFFNLAGLNIRVKETAVWSKAPDSDNFFDKHHEEIRDLKISDHLYPSNTQYYCAHSIYDNLAIFEHKREFQQLKGSDFVFLDAVDEEKVDGKLFKNTDHSMSASLRMLFDKGYSIYHSKEICAEPLTDFDMNSEFRFLCSNGYEYKINFSDNDVNMTLLKSEV